MADALDSFGQQGGFQMILDFLEQGSQSKVHIPLWHVNEICRFICRQMDMWHRQFSVKYCEKIHQAILKLLSHINPDAKGENKED
jgi:hypothetical protein